MSKLFGGKMIDDSLICLECNEEVKNNTENGNTLRYPNENLINHYMEKHEEVMAIAILAGAVRLSAVENGPPFVFFEEGFVPFEYTKNSKAYFKVG